MKDIVEKSLEIAEIAGKTLLSAIPIGGTLVAAVFDTVKGNVLAKRQARWRNIIEERLSAVETTIENIGNNEKFATMLIKTTELAIKTEKEEKIKYLANALVNSINTNMDEDKMIIFMSLIDKYTVSHLKILNFFNDPIKFETVKAKMKNYYMGSPADPLSTVYPEVMYFSDRCIKEMFNDGLMNIENIHTTMTANGMISKRTTALGDEFLDFINI